MGFKIRAVFHNKWIRDIKKQKWFIYVSNPCVFEMQGVELKIYHFFLDKTQNKINIKCFFCILDK